MKPTLLSESMLKNNLVLVCTLHKKSHGDENAKDDDDDDINDVDYDDYFDFDVNFLFCRPVPAVPHTGRVWKQVTGKIMLIMFCI